MVRLLEHIQGLGLHLNQEKSSLVPSQVTQFMGMVIDSRTATVSLTWERQETFRACLAHFCLGARVNWRLCLRLLGLMAAMVQIVPLALLYMRPVQRCLHSLRLHPQTQLQARVWVTCRLRLALRWWGRSSNLARGSRLGPVTRRQLVSSDASLVGWGSVHEGAGIGGCWGSRWASQHNVLELKEAQLTLWRFLPHCKVTMCY